MAEKTNGNDPAFPVSPYLRGLTKREEIAKSNLQGLLAGGAKDYDFAIEQAVICADKLIQQLNK